MTRDQAIDIALEALYNEIDIPDEDEIVCVHFEQTDQGWYLECNSRIYAETGDLLYALVIAPIMVHPDGSYRFIF